MCNVDSALTIILSFINEGLPAPSQTWDKNELKKNSYQRWACYEICDRLMDKPLDDPIRTISDFIFEMRSYVGVEDREANSIFQSAIEVGREMILLFV